MSELKVVMNEAKNCPCCGSEDISAGSVAVLDREELYIKCNSCGLKLQIRKEYGYGELLKRWNTRKPMENIVERLKAKAFPDFEEEYTCNGEELLYLSDAIEIVKEEGGMNDNT